MLANRWTIVLYVSGGVLASAISRAAGRKQNFILSVSAKDSIVDILHFQRCAKSSISKNSNGMSNPVMNVLLLRGFYKKKKGPPQR